MFRTTISLLALAAFLAACGGGGAGGTPEATFKATQAAVGSGDWGAFYDLLSEEGQREFRDDYEGLKAQPDEAGELGLKPEDVPNLEFRDFFIAMMKMVAKRNSEEIEQFSKSEILGTEEEGDRAAIKYKVGDDEEEMELIRIDGKWFVSDIG